MFDVLHQALWTFFVHWFVRTKQASWTFASIVLKLRHRTHKLENAFFCVLKLGLLKVLLYQKHPRMGIIAKIREKLKHYRTKILIGKSWKLCTSSMSIGYDSQLESNKHCWERRYVYCCSNVIVTDFLYLLFASFLFAFQFVVFGHHMTKHIKYSMSTHIFDYALHSVLQRVNVFFGFFSIFASKKYENLWIWFFRKVTYQDTYTSPLLWTFNRFHKYTYFE